MKIMVAYDGTLQAKEALVYGLNKAKEQGGEVIALHVFNNGMFTDYDVMDAEAMARRESERIVEEARALIRENADGVRASLFSTEGNPGEEVISFAREKQADLLLCPPRFKDLIGRHRKARIAEQAADAEKMGLAVLSGRTL